MTELFPSVQTGPVLCRWCNQDLALIGLGSPHCQKCQAALHPERWAAEAYERLSDREKALSEIQDQRDFEFQHRWGAGLGSSPSSTPLEEAEQDRPAPQREEEP